MSNTFESLGIDSWLQRLCKKIGYKTPSEIQQKSIPGILKGDDTIIHSETGSGKTVCFAFPMLQKLAKDPFGVFGLILTPSRELAIQISQQFAIFGTTINLRCALIVGGLNQIQQIKDLEKIPHIIIATPGRLRYTLEDYSQFHKYFKNIEFVVFDEADRLVEDSLWDQIKIISKYIPKKAQVILSTATLQDTLDKDNKLEQFMSKERIDRIVKHETMDDQMIPNTLIQKYLLFPKDIKLYYFVYLMRKYEDISCIVFISSCVECLHMSYILQELDINNTSLHSMLSQQQRLKNLQKFKRRQSKILLATDLASRGLDIPSVEIVVNYDIPRTTSTYIHRVGRTARQNQKGLSISFITQHDVSLIQKIEGDIGEKMTLLQGIDEKLVLDDSREINKAKRVVSYELQNDDRYEDLLKRRKKMSEQKFRQKQQKKKVANKQLKKQTK